MLTGGLNANPCAYAAFAYTQRRIQEFAKGTEEGVWRTEVPQRGPGAEPRWGSGGEALRSLTCLRHSHAEFPYTRLLTLMKSEKN